MPTGAKPLPGPFSQELAAILRSQLARKQINQAALAVAVGMSQGQLSGILNGKKHVDIEQLDALCWALGLDIIDVVREAEGTLDLRQTEPDWTVKRLVD